MAKDYYKILGVSKSASSEEIKRAYRKLALKYHPDQNKDHHDGERFKEINEAYQVLSNPQKKAQYDQFGTIGSDAGFNWGSEGADFRDFSRGFSSQGGSTSGWDFGDIFEDFLGGVFSQVQSEVEISFTSAILGDTLNLRTSQGETISFRIPPGTQNGQTFKFPGKGMATRRGRRGDLLLTVKIKMPHRLSREQKELLERLKGTGL